ncbi:MAG: SpoIIE family protein phosphatase [Cyanobacteria bacterium RI_101]|nr:SpoIIE family protein phosphatase [Cyanobacteria bacterium RI_101]
MIVVPAPPYSPPQNSAVLALKELVASLHQEQHKVQDMLSSLGFALRSFNNLNQFLELAPFMATRMTGADGSALILFKSEGKIALEQIYGRDRRLTQNIRQVMDSVIQALNNADPLTFAQGSRNLEEKIRRALGDAEPKPMVRLYSTPILVKNEELGRIYIFSEDRQYLWTQTRRKLLQLVADQTSVAIANSELTLELRSRERQDKELEIASEIQNQLLPRRCPQIRGLEIAARCQTANLVGGDYYDFIPTNYDQLGDWEEDNQPGVPWSIVIGDVMGKGVPAGLIMTMTRGMLRAEVLNRHSPAQVLGHLNRVMFADLDNSHRFVTLFYSEYDPASSTLSFSNAAHNPPLWWRHDEGDIALLDTEGALIGLEADSQYREDRVSLSPQDVVLYYTDGLTEAVNTGGERFDEGNLHRVFREACLTYDSAEGILNYIFEQVQTFRGSRGHPQDDMTLVVARVQSPG